MNKSMDITIRAANKEDAAILSWLGGKTFLDTFSPYHEESDLQLYIDKTYNENAIRNNLANPNIVYFIAYDKDLPIGYTKLILGDGHPLLKGKSIELEKIYVLQNYLDKKVGKALMEHAISYTKSNGYHTLFLGVWQENHRAVNFYKKFGFTTFDTRTFTLGKTVCDDWMMKLDVRY